MKPQAANHAVYFVPGLHRGLQVLEILGRAEAPMSLADIARAMGLSRSSAFRLVYTLDQMGFLKEAEQNNTYTLGARVLNLGFAYLNQQPITALARPHLAALRDKTGVSAHLSVLEAHDALYLNSEQARGSYVSNMTTGTRTQAYASAIGWCLLGDFGDAEIEAFCADITMQKFTEHTPTNAAELRAKVRQATAQGYVFSQGYREPGGSSVAVPIRDNTGRIAACVNVSGPDSGFDFSRIDSFYVPETRACALHISRELGYAGGT